MNAQPQHMHGRGMEDAVGGAAVSFVAVSTALGQTATSVDRSLKRSRKVEERVCDLMT
jgi:hypothetical protein